MSHKEDTTRVEDWRMVPKGEGPAVPTDLELNGRRLTGAIIQAGCSSGSFSTVVTSERYVGSIDVVANCLVLTTDREVVRRTRRHELGDRGEDGGVFYPCGIMVRLEIPRGEPGTVASGFMARASIFSNGGTLPIQDFAVSVQKGKFVEGCVVLGERVEWEGVEASLDRMKWDDEHVRFLTELLDYPGLIESLMAGGQNVD